MDYNLQFDKLCKMNDLGELISAPKELSGGLMNRMFMIETTKSKYAVKALNPTVIQRPTAMQNYINSEKIALAASKNVNAISALYFNNNAVQTIDGQHYLIFNWCCGTHLFGNNISINHCEIMGEILANIHLTDFSALGLSSSISQDDAVFDWNFYLNKGIETKAVWCEILLQNIATLYEYNINSVKAKKALSTDVVITHADLEPKNTMWVNEIPYIIDWESAGFVSRYNDILETALYWSKDKNGNFVKDKFIAFIKAYKLTYGVLHDNWNYSLDMGYLGMLGWLEYSLKRSLWIECSDENENIMGTEQVFGTIDSINKYACDICNISEWLKEI